MTIQKIQEEIINEFKSFNNSSMDEYGYLIKLGKKLPSIDSKYKIEKNRIKDCQVKSWFYSTLENGKIFYNIDSESIIARGIIGLLIRVLSNQKPEDIKNANLCFIEKIGLRDNSLLIPTGSLGKLIDRMKSDSVLYETKIN